ncbi:MAG: DMT family transporter [bacterium]|nr:DMT family transporter [bacterium]
MRSEKYLKGVLLMVASCIAFSIMSGLIRYASNIDSFKTGLFRFAIGFTLLATAALFRKIKLEFVNSKMLFARGLFGGIAVFLFFLSIRKIGMAKGTVINYSYPIFATAISAVFLKERISLVSWGMIGICFLGIFLIVTGGQGTFSSFGIFDILAIGGAITSGIAVVYVKKLHDTDSSYAIFMAQCIIGFWLVVIPANLIPCSVGISGGILLLGIGITAAIGQLLMTYGYKDLSVSTGSLLSMLVPVFNIPLGILLFNEKVSAYMLIGSALVLTSCVYMILKRNIPSKLDSR